MISHPFHVLINGTYAIKVNRGLIPRGGGTLILSHIRRLIFGGSKFSISILGGGGGSEK